MSSRLSPSDLRITDMRFTDIKGAPMDCTILRIDTNQGLTGYGELRDFSNRYYALMLKRLLLGENPCNINRIFNKIRQFGGAARQGGGVSGIEVALWDIAGRAYGIPIYQMLGGRNRDRIRIYCDTDVEGKHTPEDMGRALLDRMKAGYTMLKMDLGVDLLIDLKGAINAPLGYVDTLKQFSQQELSYGITDRAFADFMSVPHPYTFLSITDKGLDYLEDYVRTVRSMIGYEIPLAVDHIGHVDLQSCICLGKRLEKYNIAWMEDCVPWFYTDQWKRLKDSVQIKMCTGEDIYLLKNFRPLFEAQAVSVIHPDVLTAGGIGETMRIINAAQEYGIAAVVHMAESPIGCLAAAHVCAAAGDNLTAMEYHSHDVAWWNDIVTGVDGPIVKDGYITLSDKPGLGIDGVNEAVLAEHIHPGRKGIFESTGNWDEEWSHDRIWG